MFRLVTIASLTATVSAQWGYTTDTDTTGATAIGAQLLAVRAAIEGSSVEGDGTADGLCTFTSSTDFGVTEGTCVSTGSEATATCKYVAGTANADADGWETDDSCVAISWATAITAYQLDVGGGDTLANIGKKYGDTSAEYRKFKAYHEENEDYAHDFVYAALADTVQTRLPLSAPGGTPMVQLPEVAAAEPDQRGGPIGIAIKSRQELTTKGLALQTLMMATINHLYKAHDACDATEASPEQYVDQAWVLWYGAGKGPIALGEKRCIQFGTCTDNDADTFSGGCVGPSDDLDCGDSTVNSNILASFLRTQTAAKEADCDTILTEIEDVIVPQAFVPVMQGLFREAWEVDEDLRVVHSGADGFVEQVEGWAFLMAVLPRIATCDTELNTDVATTVIENVQIRNSDSDPRMVKDGFQTVIAAVEGTFECLKVACSDLNTMYGSADRVGVGTPSADACPHWNACEDGATLPREAAAVLPDPTCGEPAVGPDRTAGASRVSAVTAVVMAAIAAAVVV